MERCRCYHTSLNNIGDSLNKAATAPIPSIISLKTERKVARLLQQYTHAIADSLRWSLTIEEVAEQCSKINLRKAYGSDNIHPSFIPHDGDVHHRTLHQLFTYSYTYSTIPLQWTESLVVPIYKKTGDTANAEAYRPILLTSCVVRKMEHLIQAKLIRHISPQQHDS